MYNMYFMCSSVYIINTFRMFIDNKISILITL